MRNDELFSPHCQDANTKALVMGYVMRGLLDNNGAYTRDRLLARQYAVYEEWLAAIRESSSGFVCGFYEWLSRGCDAAFMLKPGDLVRFGDRYYVVIRRRTRELTWESSWRIRNGRPVNLVGWPKPVTEVELKDSSGKVIIVDVLRGSVEPADIPLEVFALACEKAKGCPMMKGGEG